MLEYNTVECSPSSKIFIDKCEMVQKFFTKRLHGLRDATYTARLHILKEQSLEEGRFHNDMIVMYKLYNGLLNLNVNDFLLERLLILLEVMLLKPLVWLVA